MDKRDVKRFLRKAWFFIWESDSVWSWIVNVILAFVIIKFLVYPGLGFALSTSHPIVAVVSGSMEHKIALDSFGNLKLCDKSFVDKQSVDFDLYWDSCGSWYGENSVMSKDEFHKFRNGFNKGDIMVIYGTPIDRLKLGDVIVFWGLRSDPIIHRIVSIEQENSVYFFQTKGDHNSDSFPFEQSIHEDKVVGRAVLRIPFLGYIKIFAVELVGWLF